jgi:hypothetical protein
MKIRWGAVAVLIVGLGAFLIAGCGPANEEILGGQTSKPVAHKEGEPDFKTFAEAQQYQTEQAAKNRPGGKGKPAATTAPKSQPEKPTRSPRLNEPEAPRSATDRGFGLRAFGSLVRHPGSSPLWLVHAEHKAG